MPTRLLAMIFLLALVIVGLLLGIVALRIEQIQVAYRLDNLRAERFEIERLVEKLNVEIATLTSPQRLDSAARSRGMAQSPPSRR